MKPSPLPSSKAPEHHGWPMIRSKSGVTISRQQSWTDFGIEELAFEVRWVTEPGWLALDIEVPTLCTMATEVGGRCEFRAKADQPVDGGYFGSAALAFAAAGAPFAIHAAEMRHGRLCCFAFRGAAVDYLTTEEIAAVGRLPSRYMFQNEPIRTCAALLDGGHTRGDSATFILSLSKALSAAVLQMRDHPAATSTAFGLSGGSWDGISKYIRDHLDEHVTVEALAEIAQMPPERLGRAFRNATGMSVRRWQMDQRVRGAQRLLVDNPNENLSEVAALCGFADQSHFSRAFFEVIGLTPTAWLHDRT
jgi:AraC family transcriptional regulator